MALLLPGCATVGYYSQAVRGHLDLMSRARPIPELVADPATPEPLRRRLELALELRAFAVSELALPDNGSFRRYADLGRPAAVWNVFAAPEFSVEARRWCFPVAGCVAYRGYFAQAAAQRKAEALRAEGLQTHVGAVPAYSTLGWFDDPVLSTFAGWPEAEFARLLFHELAHQRVYLRGDTAFNESYAVAVEREGVRRWLARRGTLQAGAAFERAQARREALFRLLLEHRRALAALYAEPLAPAAMRERREALRALLRERFSAFRAEWGDAGQPFAGFDAWFGDGPNNAQLASVALYHDHVPAFAALLAETGGDMAAFHRAVHHLAALPAAERRGRLARLAGGAAAVSPQDR